MLWQFHKAKSIMSNVSRKLFVSFSGTVMALKLERVTVDDLDNGLFFFGCSRAHAIDPGAHGESVASIVRQNPELHATLAGSVLFAESQGRVRWHKSDEGEILGGYELIDELLVANSCKPLVSHDEAWGDMSSCVPESYGYENVIKRSRELEVVGG